MAEPLKLNVGRERVTSAALPSEVGYIQSIRKQMALLRKNLLTVVDYVDAITPEAIEFGLKPIFEESQRLVPVDTGKLKVSGFVETRKTSTGAVAAIGYGRFGKPGYAAFVHERLDIAHRAPTQAKFLEVAVVTRIDDFRRRVALFYQRNTGATPGG
jgi:hypothetical protein